MDELHGENNNLTKQTALTEKGDVVPSPPEDTTNQHDILTGSQADGTALSGDKDMTCGNWTKSGEGAAMVGHVNRRGLDDSPAAKSWNSSHASRGPQRRLQPDGPQQHRRRRPALLLRGTN